MTRKFVGRILSGVMDLSRTEINKKQDKMDSLTVDDVKDMYPPFSVKEELSKNAPVQITLLDSNDQPMVAQTFSVRKASRKLTSGRTNNSGVCVYNEPEVMTVDNTPFTLEYNENSVELAMEYSNATYASFSVKQSIDSAPTVEVADTDGVLLPTHILFAFCNENKADASDPENIILNLYPSENDSDNGTNLLKGYNMECIPVERVDGDNSYTDLYVLDALANLPFINLDINGNNEFTGYLGTRLYSKIIYPEGSAVKYSGHRISYSNGYLSDYLNGEPGVDVNFLFSKKQLEFLINELPDGVSPDRVIIVG